MRQLVAGLAVAFLTLAPAIVVVDACIGGSGGLGAPGCCPPRAAPTCGTAAPLCGGAIPSAAPLPPPQPYYGAPQPPPLYANAPVYGSYALAHQQPSYSGAPPGKLKCATLKIEMAANYKQTFQSECSLGG